jgi:hypothetical protein
MAVYRYNVGIISRSKDKYFKNILTVNMIALTMVEKEEDLKLIIERNLNFALYHYNNLPLSIIIKNLINIPKRIFNKIFFS